MKPIFNRHGRTIGWLYNGIIYDRNNCSRAFIRDNNVFTYNAQHLGIIHKGVIFDKRGQRIAYMDEASFDPMLPIPQIVPPPPIPVIPQATPIPPIPPKVFSVSYHWNPLKWETFLDG
jgi:hypothetical protein